MKTLEKDFKGTKGDLSVYPESLTHGDRGRAPYRVDLLIEGEIVASCYGKTQEESEANARLFANSKKVLTLLIKAQIEIAKNLRYEAVKSAASFAEINNYVANDPLYKEIETAINESI